MKKIRVFSNYLIDSEVEVLLSDFLHVHHSQRSIFLFALPYWMPLCLCGNITIFWKFALDHLFVYWFLVCDIFHVLFVFLSFTDILTDDLASTAFPWFLGFAQIEVVLSSERELIGSCFLLDFLLGGIFCISWFGEVNNFIKAGIWNETVFVVLGRSLFRDVSCWLFGCFVLI